MARITTDHLLKALEESGFVLIRKPRGSRTALVSLGYGFRDRRVTRLPKRRSPFRPEVRLAPSHETPSGFTATNTFGLDGTQLAALNVALAKLIDAGLIEYQGKLALNAAVRIWLAGGCCECGVGAVTGLAMRRCRRAVSRDKVTRLNCGAKLRLDDAASGWLDPVDTSTSD